MMANYQLEIWMIDESRKKDEFNVKNETWVGCETMVKSYQHLNLDAYTLIVHHTYPILRPKRQQTKK